MITNQTFALNIASDAKEIEHSSAYDKFTLSKTYFGSQLLIEKPLVSQHLKVFDLRQPQPIAYSAEKAQSGITEHSVIDRKVNEIQLSSMKSAVSSGAYFDDIFSVSQEYNIDPLLLHAIAEVESSYNPSAVSSAGAKGLMQVMPATARRLGMKNPDSELFDPRSNLRISSNYLRLLHSIFGNNIPLILAAYNAGENAVIKYGYSIPPYKETQNYVTKVLNRYMELKDRSMMF
jgi:soluble lytic murein transglycosylase-like protein